MSDWYETELGNVCSFRAGTAFPTDFQGGRTGEYPFIKVSDLSIAGNELFVRKSNNWVSRAIAEELKAKPVRAGSVVFAKIGEGLKSERVRLTTMPTLLDNNLMAAIPGESLNPRFSLYLFATVGLSSWAAGSALPYLRQGDLARIPIRLPDLEEQRRIADVLGALDDLIDTNEQLKFGLDELARATFLRAWDGETWTTVAELGEVIMGQSPPGDTYSETPVGVPFHQGVRDFGARFPSSRIYCSAPTRIAEAGDILIAVRAPVGEMNVAPERLAIGRGLAALRASRPSTALQAIRASESTFSAHQGTGTVFSSINGKDLRSAKVPLVDDENVEAALSELDHAYAELDREGAELRRTRDELLPLLMSGAVRVRPEGVAA